MTKEERREIRAKIKTGLFTYSDTYVLRVTGINSGEIRGFLCQAVEGVKMGSKWAPNDEPKESSFHNHDTYSHFYETEKGAVMEFTKMRVQRAQRNIINAKQRIKQNQAIIDKNPEYAI